MLERLFRLVALLALVLMPFGMTTAPAAAATQAPQAAMAMPGADHCGDSSDKTPGKPAGLHCTGSCSALPSLAQPIAVATLPPEALATPALVPSLSGRSLTPSTPPPRLV